MFHRHSLVTIRLCKGQNEKKKHMKSVALNKMTMTFNSFYDKKKIPSRLSLVQIYFCWVHKV